MFIVRVLLIIFYAVVAVLFGWFAQLVFSASVLPSLIGGTLNIQGTFRILDVNWVDNEVYIIFMFYLTTSALFSYLAVRSIMFMAKNHPWIIEDN